jgi:hypothetical protein
MSGGGEAPPTALGRADNVALAPWSVRAALTGDEAAMAGTFGTFGRGTAPTGRWPGARCA